MENLVETVPAWVNLQRVREHDEDRDGELSEGDKERGRRVHCDDIRAHLKDMTRWKIYMCRTYVRTECEVAKHGDDFIGESRRADGGSNDYVHALLRVRLELIENGK